MGEVEWTEQEEEEDMAFRAFWQWKENLETDLGTCREDWEPWWQAFFAGYRAAQSNQSLEPDA